MKVFHQYFGFWFTEFASAAMHTGPPLKSLRAAAISFHLLTRQSPPPILSHAFYVQKVLLEKTTIARIITIISVIIS